MTLLHMGKFQKVAWRFRTPKRPFVLYISGDGKFSILKDPKKEFCGHGDFCGVEHTPGPGYTKHITYP